MKHSHTTKNTLYPVFLKLDQLSVLLVGAGNVGLEKLESLLGNSPAASITVVAPFVKPEVQDLLKKHPTTVLYVRAFEESDLHGKDLVVLATDNPELHKQIKELAKAKGILVNVADTPDLCDFYLGSIVQKGQLKIAISTNGKSPTAAKRIRQVLDESLPGELDDVIEKLHTIRGNLAGDFTYKVKKMNEITSSLVAKSNVPKGLDWVKIATYSSIAFILMILGHFMFSYLPLQEIKGGVIGWYKSLDSNFHWMLLAGFIAQLVDGALGMGYGVTSATILLSAGVHPAAISGSIHTAEMFSSGASGYSHYKFGNVNMKLFKRLVIPGVIGAVLGAVVLVYLGDQYGILIRPIIAFYTLFLGVKFIMNAFRKDPPAKKIKRYGLLAATGGFFDSFGGGGWGPIVTTTLINSGRSHKYAVGTVSLTEFFVTLASAFTFFQLIGISHWQTIFALIVGGFTAAPIAARLAGKLPKKTAYFLLGILVIIWSVRILVKIL